MFNKFNKIVAGFFLVALVQFASFGQAPKIGYTNLDYILSQLPEAKQVESDLQTYEKQLQTQLQTKYADYEKKLKEYQEAAQKGQLTDVIKEDKEKELMNMQNSIKEFEQSAQTSLQKKQVSLLEPVLGKVQKAIDAVGAELDYTYILSTHADYGGSAIILYAKNKEDNISDLVLKKLGVTPAPAAAADNKVGAKGTTPADPVKPAPQAPVKKTK